MDTDRRTDGRTDGRTDICIPRAAFAAEKGKNKYQVDKYDQLADTILVISK